MDLQLGFPCLGNVELIRVRKRIDRREPLLEFLRREAAGVKSFFDGKIPFRRSEFDVQREIQRNGERGGRLETTIKRSAYSLAQQRPHKNSEFPHEE